MVARIRNSLNPRVRPISPIRVIRDLFPGKAPGPTHSRRADFLPKSRPAADDQWPGCVYKPMKTAVKNVKMYAWTNETSRSRRPAAALASTHSGAM